MTHTSTSPAEAQVSTMARLRVVEYIIQPVIVSDDGGDDLTPVPVQPLRVAAREIDGFGAAFRAKLADGPVEG